MIVSNSRRFVFVHIHKTGGESIKAALEPYLDRTDVVLNDDIKLWSSRRNRKLHADNPTLHKHSTAIAIKDAIPATNWSDYYKFAFVRDPIERAISLYDYIAQMVLMRRRPHPSHARYYTRHGHRADPLSWPAVVAFRATSSFSEFLRHPALANETAMQPQADSLCDADGRLLVDFVGHVDRIQQDFAHIASVLALPVRSLPRRNSSEDHVRVRSTLNAQDRMYLEARFQVDFKLFDF
ncbi:MAG TPA: sulfotransferase family 2 domain-containing protein [Acidimicrobiales bacterium]|nr:sulfotransferase family 2 domain-containing protein [Acidimicrobiales bacterium]